ncbi:hypothetical protein ACSSS7_002536 [Eimeria intestinalis]
MGGPPVTSFGAYSFAADFVEFERQRNEELQQASARWKKKGDEDASQAVISDPKEVIGTADYDFDALLQFDYTFPSTPEEEELFEKAKLPCHLNLAACKLQQRDFDEVYIQCRLALQMDPKNCKALYRRGMAQMMQDHLDEAQQVRVFAAAAVVSVASAAAVAAAASTCRCLTTFCSCRAAAAAAPAASFAAALEAEPSNPHVIRALADLKTKKADYIKTSTETYRKMFRSSGTSQQTAQKQQKQQKQQQQQQQQQSEQQQQTQKQAEQQQDQLEYHQHQQEQQTEHQQQQIEVEQRSSGATAARQPDASDPLSASQQKHPSLDHQPSGHEAKIQHQTQQQELQQAEQQLEQQAQTSHQQQSAKQQAQQQQQPDENRGEHQPADRSLPSDELDDTHQQKQQEQQQEQQQQQQQQQEKLQHPQPASSRFPPEHKANDPRLPEEAQAAAAAAADAAEAAGAAAAGEEDGDIGCGCGVGCACGGKQVEVSRGRGFDPHSALRLMRGEPEALGSHYRRQVFVVAAAAATATATAAVGVAYLLSSCGLVTLSPAAVAGVTAAAEATAAAGPWAVGAALLLALLLGCWLLLFDSTDADDFLPLPDTTTSSTSSSRCSSKPSRTHRSGDERTPGLARWHR